MREGTDLVGVLPGRAAYVLLAALLLSLAAGLSSFLLLMQPGLHDLLIMSSALGVAAVGAGLAGLVVYRGWWLRRSSRLSSFLFGSYLFSSLLVMFTVFVAAALMFLSRHDLVLSLILLTSMTLIAVALGFMASSSLANALRELGLAERAVARGELQASVTVQGPVELAELARAFNAMTEKLSQVDAERSALERSRRELIAGVGHDLRTPLASIRLILEGLADDTIKDPQTRKRHLETAKREVAFLSALVDDLARLEHIESEAMRPEFRENSLSDLVSDTLAAFAARAQRQGVQLRGEPDGPDVFTFDAQLTGRALANLVENALAHVPEGGEVVISTASSGASAEVSVRDSGPGIDESELPHLFERYYRTSSSRSEDGGLGLGLAIVKAAAETQGGRARVSSVPGAGATFTLELPLRQRATARGPASSGTSRGDLPPA